jgi:Flp pilus assembly protein TadG
MPVSPTPHRQPTAHQPTTRPRLPRLVRRGVGGAGRDRARGQSLVEFSLILAPLLFLLLGIIQFGFVFNTYVTISTAAREAARIGSIYVYDRTLTQGANDTARNNQIKSQLLASLNGLTKTSPNFANGSTWVSATSGTTVTYTNGDLTITYELPGTVTDSDPRAGYRVTVKATYHQDLVVPIVNQLLPHDSGGRLPLVGQVTMVIN